MRELAIIYGALFAQIAVFASANWLLARAIGAPITLISLGSPGLVTLRRANPKVTLGPFPSGSVDLLGRAEASDDPRSWGHHGLGARLLVIIGPWILCMAIAIACLGPARVGRSFASAFYQVLFALDVTPFVRGLIAVAKSAPFYITLGIVLVKSSAVNLLPLGGLAGGGVLRELFGGTDRIPRWVVVWSVFSLAVLMFWMLGRFGWALIAVLRD